MKPVAVLLALSLAAPAAAQGPAAPPASNIAVKYTQFTLPNGLRVILHEDHSVPIVTVNSGTAPGRRTNCRAARASRICSST